jgi:hypothetical protein
MVGVVSFVVCSCCRLLGSTLCGSVMVGSVVVAVHQ